MLPEESKRVVLEDQFMEDLEVASKLLKLRNEETKRKLEQAQQVVD